MIKKNLKPTGCLFFMVLFISCGMSDEIKLFNGESLEGWEGSKTVFRAEQGAIVGASLEKPLDESKLFMYGREI